MNKKYFSIITIINVVILITLSGFFPGKLHAKMGVPGKKLVKKLDKKYREWFDLVHYIITRTEKNVFLKLTNNRDRDTFINLFWNLRDPTKGTPDNEFKQEHLKRFSHASRYFKYESPLPGWKTDRGRIYIVLGPPLSKIEVNRSGLYPVEIWEYFGDVQNGLPTVFRMVFYKRGGGGGFKLYIPIVDGPASLLQTQIGQIDTNNFYKVYKKIREIDPEVSDIALTLIPGESLYDYKPSLRGPMLISKIHELPKKKINASYAKNFLNYKGIVETSVITNYINATCDLYTIKDPLLDLNFIHIAISPERISVDYSEEKDQYYFNINLMVILNKGKNTVMQYNKDFPFYFTKQELDKKISHGMVITDHFPVVNGKFKLVIILQNSINKELSYYEKMIDTTSSGTSLPKIFDPFISYQINMNDRMGYSSFRIMGRNIKIDPKRTFGLKEILSTLFCVEKGSYNKNFHVELEVKSQDESRKYSKKYSFEFPREKSFWCFSKDLEQLKYGYYSLAAMVVGEKGIILDVKEKEFQVSPLSYIPHPPMVSRTLKIENKFYFYMNTAIQYQNLKKYSDAETYYEKAFRLNPTFPELIKSYSSFLLNRGKYDKMLEVIENLKGQKNELFHYYSYKGRAFYNKKEYNSAIDTLLKAVKIYDSDVVVLNTLGFALIRTGEKEEALKALSASLKINEFQEEIKNILEQLNKEITNEKSE